MSVFIRIHWSKRSNHVFIIEPYLEQCLVSSVSTFHCILTRWFMFGFEYDASYQNKATHRHYACIPVKRIQKPQQLYCKNKPPNFALSRLFRFIWVQSDWVKYFFKNWFDAKLHIKCFSVATFRNKFLFITTGEKLNICF